MNGILRQVDEVQLQHLLNKPDEVMDFVDSEVPTSEEIELDKAWHGLHFMLTGEAWEGAEPLCYLLSSGEQIGDEEDHDVGYGPARCINAQQVKNFSDALSGITEKEFSSRYDSQKMTALELYPRGWEEEPVEMRDWLTQSFIDLQKFVKKAASRNKALLVWLQ
ncbi:MAG: YfbM family protein [Bacteroidota bacterium]|nr:YfbM family protein [Bacteroidota bacterium]